MTDFWIKLGEVFQYVLSWLNTNAPEIMDWLKNLTLTGGLSAITFGLFKYVIPLFKNNNKPVLKELALIKEEVTKLKEENISLRQDNNIKNMFILKYVALSCEVNSKSITLDEIYINSFKELANEIKEPKNASICEQAQGDIIISPTIENVAAQKIEPVLDGLAVVANVAIEGLQSVNDLKNKILS